MIKNKEKALSIYIHIPFCIKKCRYCDFLSVPAEEVVRERYVRALCEEIREEAAGYQSHRTETVFFGGGTPSLLHGEQIKRIMSVLRDCFRVEEQAEVTLEANPGTLTEEKLSAYREAGVNRLSIGLQSADNTELAYLGRVHTWEQFLESWRISGEAGFTNRNIDLMSALPGQSVDSCRRTLEKVCALEPSHISAYSLMIEEGTEFYGIYGGGGRQGAPPLPSEDDERRMYELTERVLADRGYARYEISNYAREGFECRHNKAYWTRRDYAGFGVGAASMVGNVRWSNGCVLEKYMTGGGGKSRRENIQALTVQEQMEEFMFLGLRLTKGVQKKEFLSCFDREMDEVYGKILRRLDRDGLLINGETVSLTKRGVDVSNCVLAEFLF